MTDKNNKNDNNIFIKISEWCKRPFLHQIKLIKNRIRSYMLEENEEKMKTGIYL